MPGRATAVRNGHELRASVVSLGENLGLSARTEVRVGRRLWGAQRCIDVVLTRKDTGKALGLECKFQGGAGTAEEKLPATIQDISAWPIEGLVVFAGDGFSGNMRSYLYSTGKAVDLVDLEGWLRLFFGLTQV
jgi:hypothetical protein